MNEHGTATPEAVLAQDEQAESGVVAADDRLDVAAEVLRQMLLRARDGAVSTQALRKELEGRGIQEPQELIARLRSVPHNPTVGHTGTTLAEAF